MMHSSLTLTSNGGYRFWWRSFGKSMMHRITQPSIVDQGRFTLYSNLVSSLSLYKLMVYELREIVCRPFSNALALTLLNT